MPTIFRICGVLIKMYVNDHYPPHFHAEYNEFTSMIDIYRLEEINGNLPKKQLKLVLDWADIYQRELIENWNRCKNGLQPEVIND